jgi:hypothetical protein
MFIQNSSASAEKQQTRRVLAPILVSCSVWAAILGALFSRREVREVMHVLGTLGIVYTLLSFFIPACLGYGIARRNDYQRLTAKDWLVLLLLPTGICVAGYALAPNREIADRDKAFQRYYDEGCNRGYRDGWRRRVEQSPPLSEKPLMLWADGRRHDHEVPDGIAADYFVQGYCFGWERGYAGEAK